MSKKITVYDKYGDKSPVTPYPEHGTRRTPIDQLSREMEHHNYQLTEFSKWLDQMDKDVALFRARVYKAVAIAFLGLAIVIGIGLWSASRADTVSDMISAAAGITASKNLCGHTATETQQTILDMAEILIAVPENLELLKGEMLMHIVKEDEIGNEEYCLLSRAAMAASGT